MSHRTGPDLLVLHGVRLLGGPTLARLAARCRLDPAEVREHLLDAQAWGWVSRTEFFGDVTWSLTAAGRDEDERRLAAELEATGARPAVVAAHRAFGPLNARHGVACTNWQLRPEPFDALSFNDHTDPDWDLAVLAALAELDRGLAGICAGLAGVLARFGGHAERHHDALERARRGDHAWVDAPDRDSCQLVWMQFHEDLLATLGIPRGADS